MKKGQREREKGTQNSRHEMSTHGTLCEIGDKNVALHYVLHTRVPTWIVCTT